MDLINNIVTIVTISFVVRRKNLT